MPHKVPTHGVGVSRPTGRKDKDGNDIHQTIRPKIGEPFDFTHDEVRELHQADPRTLRDPINERGARVDDDDAEADQVRSAAAANRAAPEDAVRVSRAGARGRGARRQEDNDGRGEAPGAGAVRSRPQPDEDEDADDL